MSRLAIGLGEHFEGRLRGVRPARLAVLVIVAIAAWLRFAEIDDTGQNLYYAAGVRSMLLSWHNFFFVSFDPGGSLMIDKPPLGLWLETAAARVLGFHYWVLALPQALAGVAAVFVLYRVTRLVLGEGVALLAAVFLAVLPASVASARNNTFDTLTMCLVLCAAWALLRAVGTGRVRWLVACAMLLGLAFNTKMAEAFLPLPAFALYYWRGSLLPVRSLVLRGALFAAVLAAVSLAWVSAVGLTAASDRPSIYNGEGNSIWRLTFEYNGLYRVIGIPAQPRIRSTGPTLPSTDTANLLEASKPPPRGPARLFWGRLGTQIGWLMPLAIAGIVVVWRRRADRPGDLLWASWFVSGVVFFSFAKDAVPAYLEAIAAPSAILAAIGVTGLVPLVGRRITAAALVAALLCYEAALLASSGGESQLAIPVVALAIVAGAGFPALRWFGASSRRRSWLPAGAVVAGLLAGPFAWSAVTALEPAVGSAARYPVAGPEESRPYQPAAGGDLPPTDPATGVRADPVLAHLEANTAGAHYLVLTERALFGNAARYILATGRPVLTFDTFQGDEAEATRTVSALVAAGQLRFLELPPSGPWTDPERPLGQWFLAHCGDITTDALRPLGGESHLYECR